MIDVLGYEVELLNPQQKRLVTRGVWANDGALLIPAGGAVTLATTVIVIPRGDTERHRHEVTNVVSEGLLDRLTLRKRP